MLRTEILFVSLLKELAVDCICDVGSMDGSHAILFKKACPNALVFAFEANPYNYRRMLQDGRLQVVDRRHMAVSDFSGIAKFYIAPADYDHDRDNRGQSSLLPDEHFEEEVCQVPATRMDDFLGREAANNKRIAMWIDVEGAGWEVLSGCRSIVERLELVHIEVEKKPMKQGQKLYQDVSRLMEELGFVELASNFRGTSGRQGDIVGIRRTSFERCRASVKRALVRSRIVSSLRLQPILQKVLPAHAYRAAKNIYGRYLA